MTKKEISIKLEKVVFYLTSDAYNMADQTSDLHPEKGGNYDQLCTRKNNVQFTIRLLTIFNTPPQSIVNLQNNLANTITKQIRNNV